MIKNPAIALGLVLAFTAIQGKQGKKMAAQQIRAQVEKAIQVEWERIARAIPPGAANPGSPGWISWEYRVSPPFPGEWPPEGTGTVSYYAYAAGLELSLMDAERLGPVWARVTVNVKGDSPPRVEIFTREIKAVGTIGVRPLTDEEIAVYKQRDAVVQQIYAASCQTDLKGLDAKAIRQYYCAWSQNTGMGEQIRKYHPEFFKWLSGR